jgi:hypothetical protein
MYIYIHTQRQTVQYGKLWGGIIPNSGAEHPLPLLPSAFFYLKAADFGPSLNLPWLLQLFYIGHRWKKMLEQ